MKYVMTKEGPAVLLKDVIAEIEKERPVDRPTGTGQKAYFFENGQRNACDALVKVFKHQSRRIERKQGKVADGGGGN